MLQSPPLTSTSGCTILINFSGVSSSKYVTISTQRNAATTATRSRRPIRRRRLKRLIHVADRFVAYSKQPLRVGELRIFRSGLLQLLNRLGTSTTFGNLETRTGSVGDGRYALRGDELTITPDARGRDTSKFRIRIYDHYNKGGWVLDVTAQ